MSKPAQVQPAPPPPALAPTPHDDPDFAEVIADDAEIRAVLRTLDHMGETAIAVSEWDLARELQSRGFVELRRRDMRDWTWRVTAAGRSMAAEVAS